MKSLKILFSFIQDVTQNSRMVCSLVYRNHTIHENIMLLCYSHKETYQPKNAHELPFRHDFSYFFREFVCAGKGIRGRKTMVELMELHNINRLIFTGHSLGGVEAQVYNVCFLFHFIVHTFTPNLNIYNQDGVVVGHESEGKPGLITQA